jgi:hypothetical protein
MKILTATIDSSGKNVSINCDQILYALEHQESDKCVVVTAAGDMLVVRTNYLEVVGFLKAID